MPERMLLIIHLEECAVPVDAIETHETKCWCECRPYESDKEDQHLRGLEEASGAYPGSAVAIEGDFVNEDVPWECACVCICVLGHVEFVLLEEDTRLVRSSSRSSASVTVPPKSSLSSHKLMSREGGGCARGACILWLMMANPLLLGEEDEVRLSRDQQKTRNTFHTHAWAGKL